MATNKEILKKMGYWVQEVMGEKFYQNISGGNGYSADKKLIETAMDKAREDEQEKMELEISTITNVADKFDKENKELKENIDIIDAQFEASGVENNRLRERIEKINIEFNSSFLIDKFGFCMYKSSEDFQRSITIIQKLLEKGDG